MTAPAIHGIKDWGDWPRSLPIFTYIIEAVEQLETRYKIVKKISFPPYFGHSRFLLRISSSDIFPRIDNSNYYPKFLGLKFFLLKKPFSFKKA